MVVTLFFMRPRQGHIMECVIPLMGFDPIDRADGGCTHAQWALF